MLSPWGRYTILHPLSYQVSMVPAQMKKTMLDVWNVYHSLLVSSDTQDTSTCITEWDRSWYLWAPQGFHTSGDMYTCQFDISLLIWLENLLYRWQHILDWLNRNRILAHDRVHCSKNGINFNLEKFHFPEEEVEFAGFWITRDSVNLQKKMSEAIQQSPTHMNITSVRSRFGPVKQVSYTFAQAEIMAPFCELLCSKRPKVLLGWHTRSTVHQIQREGCARNWGRSKGIWS